jgi:hypothetical protein
MDNVLLLSVVSVGSALIGLLIKYGFKSKCSDISICFGLLNIKRDTASELEERNLEIVHNVKEDDSNKV